MKTDWYAKYLETLAAASEPTVQDTVLAIARRLRLLDAEVRNKRAVCEGDSAAFDESMKHEQALDADERGEVKDE